MSKHSCARCGAPKQNRWHRCKHCDVVTGKYRRGVDRDRVHAFKARVAAMREARRANDKVIAMRHTVEVCRYNERVIREKWGIFERELNRLLSNWVGWPPQQMKVRELPPRWRIAYQERMPAMLEWDSPDAALSIELRVEDLYAIETLVREDIERWGMHIALRDSHDTYAYYIDERSPIEGYALQHVIEQIARALNERRQLR